MANGETHALAEVLAAYVRTHKLCELYGGDVVEAINNNNRKYLSIGWSVLRFVNGEICVYSPHFIIVKYNGTFQKCEDADQALAVLKPWAKEPDFGDQLTLPETGGNDFDELASSAPPAYPDEGNL